MTDDPIDLLGFTSDAFVDTARARGRSRNVAIDAYRAAYRDGMPDAGWARAATRPIASRLDEAETVKLTIRLEDDLEAESVVIPMRGRRGQRTWTLCVSSQVGCAMGCTFCETAQMGLLRNISVSEIIAQWYAARHDVERPIKNVVFMGMGEPMDNLDAVIGAISVLADHNGPSVPPANIAVSTVGRVDGITALGDFARNPGFGRLNLAVSINAPNDEIRSEIMPINRAAPMDALMEAMLAWPRRAAAAICVEYVLIPGVNDALEHADELCAYLRPLRCSLNVIPYNPRRDSPWPAPSEDAVAAFIDRAMANGQFVKRRGTKGRDVMAACGQLGNEHIRRRRRAGAAVPLRVESGTEPTGTR